MKLVRWYILFSILCFMEQIIQAQQSQLSENDVDQPKSLMTPLDGKHLRMIIAPVKFCYNLQLVLLMTYFRFANWSHARMKLPGINDVERNSTGHVVQVAGTIPLALDWLSRRYNFT